jgi:hypothetical protein
MTEQDLKRKAPGRLMPVTIRSRLLLEVASELSGDKEQPYQQASVQLHIPNTGGTRPLTMISSNAFSGIHAVAKGEADLAMTNPCSSLALAVRGKGVFKEPLPVAAIGIIPSYDVCLFAARPETGLAAVEEIAAKRPKLALSLRGQADHWINFLFDDIAAVTGFSLADIERWGGEWRKEGWVPFTHSERYQDLIGGRFTAMFDESANSWCDQAAEAGMRILTLSEATVQKLEAMGYRRGLLLKELYPHLPHDILTIEFSGWPVIVHADAPDDVVTHICAAFDARKDRIAWQGFGPLPVERWARDNIDTPLLFPIHPAAERYWRSRGYLD